MENPKALVLVKGASSFSLQSFMDGSDLALSEVEEFKEVKNLKALGDQALNKKEYAEALFFYHEALEIDEHSIEVLTVRAATFLETENYNLAKQDADRIISLKPDNHKAFYLLARAQDNMNDFASAFRNYLRALDYDKKGRHIKDVATHVAMLAANFCTIPQNFKQNLKGMDAYKKLTEVGAYLFQGKRFDMCVSVLNSAKRLETNQQGITMKLLLTLANAHASMRRRELAISIFKECYSTALAAHDVQYQTKSLVSIASIFQELGNTYQAIVHYEKLVSLERELRGRDEVGMLPDYWNKELQCALSLNLSIAYKNIGNISRAMIFANRYLELVDDFEIKGVAEGQSHQNLGMLYEIIGNYQKAMEHYKKFASISKANCNKNAIAQAYGCLGSIFARLKNKAMSLTLHEQHVNLAKKSNDPRMAVTAYEQMGDSLMVLNLHGEATQVYMKMLKACKKGDLLMQTSALCKLGNAYKAMERFQYALYYYDQAKSRAEDFEYEGIRTVCDFNMSCILQHSSQMFELDQAEKLLEELIPMYEAKIQQHKEEGTHCLPELHNQLAECYQAMQNVHSKLGKKEMGLQISENYKKRSITEWLLPRAGMDHSNVTLPPTDSREQWLMDKILRTVNHQTATVLHYSILPLSVMVWVLKPGEGLVRFYGSRPAKSNITMNEKIVKLVNDMKKCEKLDDIYKIENRALPLPNDEIKIIQKKYAVLSKMDEKEDFIQSLQREAPIDDKAEWKVTKSPQRKLFDLLVAPIEDVLSKLEEGSPLIVIPDGAMFDCPFGGIQDWNGKMLSEKFRITCLPSLFLLDRANESALNYLKMEDEINVLRAQHFLGGVSKIYEVKSQADASKSQREMRANLYALAASESRAKLKVEEIDSKKVTNPRLLKSGHLQETLSPKVQQLTKESAKLDELTEMSKVSPRTTIEECISNPQPLGSPTKIDKVTFLHSLQTITTKTSTGTDITGSHMVATEFMQVSDKDRCLVIGCPSLPEVVMFNGKPWKPHQDLLAAQEECYKVANFFDVIAMIDKYATKDAFLQNIGRATIAHIATIGCLQEGLLAFVPNPLRNQKGPPEEHSYLVTIDDIITTPMIAKLVVLNSGNSGYKRSYIDNGYRLASAFIASGCQSVLLSLWPLPNDALDKFYYHFYAKLAGGAFVSEAIKAGSEALKQDDRYKEPVFWSSFIVIGTDVFLHLKEIRHSMLDQDIDVEEEKVIYSMAKDPLHPKPKYPDVVVKEEHLTLIQAHFVRLLAHHTEQPEVIPQLIELMDSALKRLYSPENNKKTVRLHDCFAKCEGGMDLLKLLDFHFQAKGAYVANPYVVFPHWNLDGLLMPVYDALRVLPDISTNTDCARTICEFLPTNQELVSQIIDVLCMTKNASQIQLKTTDLSVMPVWNHKRIRNILTTIGFHQIGVLLHFNSIPSNRVLLSAVLQLFICLSDSKSTSLMHKLDMELLGRGREKEQSVPKVRLPTLTPLLLPRNQVTMSTPWFSTAEKEEEMDEKMKLSHNQVECRHEYNDITARSKKWHKDTLGPQANEALWAVGRRKIKPTKVKVVAGGSASMNRVPIDLQPVLNIEETDQRRDYATYLLDQRMHDICTRYKNDMRKLYLPHIQNV